MFQKRGIAFIDMDTSYKNKVNQISNGARIVFLDRDGVVNKCPGDQKYVTNLSEFEFLAGVLSAIARLTKIGYSVFIISNQAGVSKGMYSSDDLKDIDDYLLKMVKDAGGNICGIYYCIHQDKDECLCRKPKPGLIFKAVRENEIDQAALKRSFFIGDSIRDVLTARQAGIKSILVFSGKEKFNSKNAWEVNPDYTAKDLDRKSVV